MRDVLEYLESFSNLCMLIFSAALLVGTITHRRELTTWGVLVRVGASMGFVSAATT